MELCAAWHRLHGNATRYCRVVMLANDPAGRSATEV